MIDRYYKQPVRRSKTRLFGKVREACREAGFPPPDPKSIRRLLERYDAYELRRAREGDRGAYDDKPYLPIDPDAAPASGLYPLQRAHFDFTTVDLETVDEETQANLGRPNLGRLVDAYTGRTLSWVWTYAEPTQADVMEALVECVERFGRLPEELILDRAMAHKGKQLQKVLAAQGVDVTYRLTGEGRFGGPVERSFGTTNTRLWHQLAGNTQATRTARKLTPQVDPRRLATLSLSAADQVYREYLDQIEDQQLVPRLGMSVRDAFEQGVMRHGRRERRLVNLESFRLLALPSAGIRNVHRQNGTFVNYLYYWHPCFGHAGVAGKRVEVAQHPDDISRIEAFVPAHHHGADRIGPNWVTAEARRLAGMRVVSRAELALVTKVLRQAHSREAGSHAALEARIVALLKRADEIDGYGLLEARANAMRRASGSARLIAPRPTVVERPTTADEPTTTPAADVSAMELPVHERRFWEQYAEEAS